MTSAPREPKPSDDRDLESRAEAIRSAVASARLEGLIITPATREAFDDYVPGSIDADKMIDRVLRRYGPAS